MKNDFVRDKYFWLISFLVIFSIVLKIPGLNPDSLWLDDLWVALVSKANNFDDFLLVNGPAPILFTFFQWLSSKIIRDKELSMQIIPFIFGTSCIPLFYLFVCKFTKSKILGFLSSAILAINNILLIYSVRAKQYSIEAFFVILLLCFFEKLNKNRENFKTWLKVFFVSLLALGFSFNSMLVSGFFLNYFGVEEFVKDKWKSLKKVILVFIFDFSLVFYYLGFLKPKSSKIMLQFWNNKFIDLDQNLLGILNEIIEKLIVVILNAFPKFQIGFSRETALASGYRFLAFIVLFFLVLGINSIWKKRRKDWVLFIVIFYISLIFLSIVKIYPLGGVRTDIFTYPITILLFILGLEKLFKIKKWANDYFIYIFLLLIILLQPKKIKYSDQDEEFLCVNYVLKEINKDKKVLVFPHSNFSLSYYSNFPVKFEKTNAIGTGYFPKVENSNIYSLDFYKDYWAKPELLNDSLFGFEDFIAEEKDFYFILEPIQSVFIHVNKYLESINYKKTQPLVRKGCIVFKYVKN